MKTDSDRFLSKLSKTATCWLWTASVTGCGYGQFYSHKLGSKKVDAHRHSYAFYKGDIPPNTVVMHTCDVKICVNPDHLQLGSILDNMRDMYQKKRNRSRDTYLQQSGEKAWNAVLTNEQARAIKKEYVPNKYGAHKIARRYGVSKSTIQNILNGKTYGTA